MNLEKPSLAATGLPVFSVVQHFLWKQQYQEQRIGKSSRFSV